MEENFKEKMEKKETITVPTDDDEPEINYRGWKAMPFIIGDLKKKFLVCFMIFFAPLIFLTF